MDKEERLKTIQRVLRDEENYYIVLQVSKVNFKLDELTKQYRNLSKCCHPDKNADLRSHEQKQANQATQIINQAYEMLSDAQLRAQYDFKLALYLRSKNLAREQAENKHSATSSNAGRTKSESGNFSGTNRSQSYGNSSHANRSSQNYGNYSNGTHHSQHYNKSSSENNSHSSGPNRSQSFGNFSSTNRSNSFKSSTNSPPFENENASDNRRSRTFRDSTDNMSRSKAFGSTASMNDERKRYFNNLKSTLSTKRQKRKGEHCVGNNCRLCRLTFQLFGCFWRW